MSPLIISLQRYLSSSLYKLPWNPDIILIVLGHAMKFSSSLDDGKLNHIFSSLNDLAEECLFLHKRIFDCTLIEPSTVILRQQHINEELRRNFVNTFVPEVRKLFVVPKLQQLEKSVLENEILAFFMDFLLLIMDSHAASYSGDQEDSYVLLQTNLRFVLTILGDAPFQCTELEDVKNLLVEFESLANEIGNFVYAYAFSTSEELMNKNFDASIHALLEDIETFSNGKIKEHCIRSSQFPRTVTSRSSPLHSLFIVDSLLEDLKGLVNCGFSLNFEIKDQIRTLIMELTFFQNFFEDIDIDIDMSHVIYTNELKEFAIEAIDLACEAEYLINTHVGGRIPTWYMYLRLPAVVKKAQLTRTCIQDIKKVNDIKATKGYVRGLSFEVVRNPEVLIESTVIGFEDNRTKILDDIIGGSKRLQSVCILGMPGIGKTTIAKKLYNDRSVYDHFYPRVWCVVSQTYTKRKVLSDILISIGSDLGKDNTLEDESLGLKIYQSLYGRKYIIIMDDVWHANMWDDLRKYFPDDGNGSRILLTTRQKDTAPTDCIFFETPLLLESQCCDLLVTNVFNKKPCPPELMGIANRIASKCHGVPLAVVVVAGILANVGDEARLWENVEKNLNSYLFDDQSNYTKILELSYKQLPNHLKPCFLYMGTFPVDIEIPIRNLTSLWISEGFVHKKKHKSPEHVAEEYLVDLINRSLLMIVNRGSDGGIKTCRIHDLLRDMCLRIAEEENFLKYINKPSFYEKHSHLVLPLTPMESWSNAALQCRSVTGYISGSGFCATQMPLLRVIHLLGWKYFFFGEMTGLCSLVHLRLLHFAVSEIPKGLCKLVNLEYLYLEVSSTVFVPSSILKMMKLRHVRITPEAVFEKDCDNSQVTNNLRSISCVRINTHEEEGILICSPHLRKLKCVCDGSLFPDLLFVNELESLALKCGSYLKGGQLTTIHFPSTIKRLSLQGFQFQWKEMSIVGRLPNLHVLKIHSDAFCGKEWRTRDEEFQELRFLRLSEVSLEQWTTCSEHFPRLQCLVLNSVRDLLKIPSELGDIPTLRTIDVRYCIYDVYISAVQIEEEQLDYGNEDLKVLINSDIWSKEELVQQLKQGVDSCPTEEDECIVIDYGQDDTIFSLSSLTESKR